MSKSNALRMLEDLGKELSAESESFKSESTSQKNNKLSALLMNLGEFDFMGDGDEEAKGDTTNSVLVDKEIPMNSYEKQSRDHLVNTPREPFARNNYKSKALENLENKTCIDSNLVASLENQNTRSFSSDLKSEDPRNTFNEDFNRTPTNFTTSGHLESWNIISQSSGMEITKSSASASKYSRSMRISRQIESSLDSPSTAYSPISEYRVSMPPKENYNDKFSSESIEILQAQILELKAKIQERDSVIADYSNTCEQLMLNNNHLAPEYKNLEVPSPINQENERILSNDIQAALDKTREEYKKLEDELGLTKKQIEMTSKQYQIKEEIFKNEMNHLQDLIQTQSLEHETLKSEIEIRHQSFVEKTKEEIQTLSNINAEKQNEIISLCKANDTLNTEMKNKSSAYNQQLQKYETSNQELILQSSKAEASLQSALITVNELKNEVVFLNAQVILWEKKSKESVEQLEQYQNKIQDAHLRKESETVQSYEAKIQNMRNEFSLTIEKVNNEKNKIEMALKNEIFQSGTLRREKDALILEIDILQKGMNDQTAELQRNLKNQELRLIERDFEVKHLSSETATLLSSLQESKDAHSSKEKELRDALQGISVLNARILILEQLNQEKELEHQVAITVMRDAQMREIAKNSLMHEERILEIQSESARREKENLEILVVSLKEKLSLTDNEIRDKAALKTETDELREKISVTEEICNQAAELRDNFESQRLILMMKDSEINALQEKLRNITSGAKRISSNDLVSKEAYSKKEQELADAQQYISALNDMCVTLRTSCRENDEKLQEALAEMNDSHMRDMNERIQIYEDKIREMQTEASQVIKKFKEEKEILEMTISSQKDFSRCENSISEKEISRTELNDSEGHVHLTEGKCDQKTNEFEDLLKEKELRLFEKDNEVNALKVELERISSDAACILLSANQSKEAYSKIEQELSDALNFIGVLDAKCSSLEKSILESDAKNQEALSWMRDAQMRDTADKIQTYEGIIRGKRAEFSSAIEKLSREKEKLEIIVVSLKEELSQSEAIKRNKEELQKEMNELREKLMLAEGISYHMAELRDNFLKQGQELIVKDLELNVARAELKHLTTETSLLSSSVYDTKEAYSRKEQELTNALDNISALNAKCLMLEKSLLDNEENFRHSQQEALMVQGATLREAGEKIQIYEAKLQEIHTEIKILNEEKDKSEKIIVSLENENSQNENLRREREFLLLDINNLRERITLADEQTAKMSDNLKNQDLKLIEKDSTIYELRSEIEHLSSEAASLTSRGQEIERAYSEKGKELIDALNIISSLESKCLTLENFNRDIESQHQELMTRMSDAQTLEIAKKSQIYENLIQNNQAEFLLAIENMQRENKKYEIEVISLKEELLQRENIIRDKETLQLEINELQQKLSLIDENSNQVDELKANLVIQEQKLREKDSKLNELRIELENTTKNTENLKSSANETKNAYCKMEQELVNALNNISALDAKCLLLEKSLLDNETNLQINLKEESHEKQNTNTQEEIEKIRIYENKVQDTQRELSTNIQKLAEERKIHEMLGFSLKDEHSKSEKLRSEKEVLLLEIDELREQIILMVNESDQTADLRKVFHYQEKELTEANLKINFLRTEMIHMTETEKKLADALCDLKDFDEKYLALEKASKENELYYKRSLQDKNFLMEEMEQKLKVFKYDALRVMQNAQNREEADIVQNYESMMQELQTEFSNKVQKLNEEKRNLELLVVSLEEEILQSEDIRRDKQALLLEVNQLREQLSTAEDKGLQEDLDTKLANQKLILMEKNSENCALKTELLHLSKELEMLSISVRESEEMYSMKEKELIDAQNYISVLDSKCLMLEKSHQENNAEYACNLQEKILAMEEMEKKFKSLKYEALKVVENAQTREQANIVQNYENMIQDLQTRFSSKIEYLKSEKEKLEIMVGVLENELVQKESIKVEKEILLLDINRLREQLTIMEGLCDQKAELEINLKNQKQISIEKSSEISALQIQLEHLTNEATAYSSKKQGFNQAYENMKIELTEALHYISSLDDKYSLLEKSHRENEALYQRNLQENKLVNEELEQRLEFLKKEALNANDSVILLNAQLKKNQSEMDELCSEYTNLMETHMEKEVKYNSTLKALQNKIESLENTQPSTNERFDNNKILESKEEKHQLNNLRLLENENIRLKEEIEGLKDTIEENKRTISSLETKFSEYDQQQDINNKASEKLVTRLKQSHLDIDELKQKLTKKNDMILDQEFKFTESIMEKSALIESLECENRELSKTLDATRVEIQMLKDVIGTYTLKIEMNETQKSYEMESIQSLEPTIPVGTWLTEKRDLETIISDLKVQLKETETRFSIPFHQTSQNSTDSLFDSSIKDSQKKKNRINNIVLFTKNDMTPAKTDPECSGESIMLLKINQLKETLSSKDNYIKQLEIDFTEIRAKKIAAEDELERLKYAELDSFTEASAKNNCGYEALKLEICELKNQLCNTENQLVLIKAKAATLEFHRDSIGITSENLNELVHRCKEYQDKLNTSESEMVRILEENKRFTKIISDIKGKLVRNTNYIEEMEYKVSKYEKEINHNHIKVLMSLQDQQKMKEFKNILDEANHQYQVKLSIEKELRLANEHEIERLNSVVNERSKLGVNKEVQSNLKWVNGDSPVKAHYWG